MSKGWHAAGAPGGSRAWERLRASVLEENRLSKLYRGQCNLAIPDTCTGPATVVHHVVGRRRSGDQRDLLMATCSACNLHVGDPLKQPDPPARPVSRW